MIRRLYPLRVSANLFYYVTEAALIGGIADWFAVAALFKKPLGWPYHTALIPRNRAKLIEAVANMVEDDLLSIELLKERMATVDFAGIWLDWLEHSDALRRAAAAINQYLSHNLSCSDDLTDGLTRGIREWLSGTSAQTLWHLLANDINMNGPAKHLEDLLFQRLPHLASGPAVRQAIYTFLYNQINQKRDTNRVNKFTVNLLERTNLLDLDEAATILQRQILISLTRIQHSRHPLRQSLATELHKTLQNLASSPATSDLRNQMPALIDQLPWYTMVRTTLQKLTKPDSPGNAGANPEALRPKLEYLLEQILKELLVYFKDSPTLCAQINQSILELVTGVLVSHHGLIGDTVRRTLNSLSDQELNSFIEDKAGEDLQWIRINGSLIGGLAGLVIFLTFNVLISHYVLFQK